MTIEGRIEKESYKGLTPGKLYTKKHEKWAPRFLYSWGYVVSFYGKAGMAEETPLECLDHILLFVGAGYPTSGKIRFPVFLCPDGNLRVPDVTCCDDPLVFMELVGSNKL